MHRQLHGLQSHTVSTLGRAPPAQPLSPVGPTWPGDHHFGLQGPGHPQDRQILLSYFYTRRLTHTDTFALSIYITPHLEFLVIS